MSRTLLVLGPASTGKSTLLRALAGEHPDHYWHLVQLAPSDQETRIQLLRATMPGWAGLWQMHYRADEVLAALPDLVRQIEAGASGQSVVIAFEATPDSLLRHAYAYDLRVFVVPPIHDESIVFRSPDEARRALRQILRDSATFASEVSGLSDTEGDAADPARPASGRPEAGGGVEVNELQVQEFLTQPLGVELAMRVHLQEEFSAIADADIIILNTKAELSFGENNLCWQRMLGLLNRLRSGGRQGPLTYACDLSDAEDPCFVRIRHRMAEAVCKV